MFLKDFLDFQAEAEWSYNVHKFKYSGQNFSQKQNKCETEQFDTAIFVISKWQNYLVLNL